MSKKKISGYLVFCTILFLIVYLIVDIIINALQIVQVDKESKPINKHSNDVSDYTSIMEYVVDERGLSGIKLCDGTEQADKRVSTTDYHTLRNNYEYIDTDILTLMQEYLQEQQMQIKLRNADTDTELYTEICSENTCIGYLKYTTQITAGNAVYKIPNVTVIHIKRHADGVVQKTILQMNTQAYDAVIAQDVLKEFLSWVDSTLQVETLLSITDKTGTYIPFVEFTTTPEKYFEFDSTTGTIVEYRINDKDAPIHVYIPETISGVTVKSIGKNAFYKYYETERSIQSVVIPNTVTCIQENAFKACTELQNVIIPSTVVAIGEGAFAGCNSLETVTLSQNITDLPAQCFKGASALQVLNNVKQIQTYYADTFDGCNKLDLSIFTDVVVYNKEE